MPSATVPWSGERGKEKDKLMLGKVGHHHLRVGPEGEGRITVHGEGEGETIGNPVNGQLRHGKHQTRERGKGGTASDATAEPPTTRTSARKG